MADLAWGRHRRTERARHRGPHGVVVVAAARVGAALGAQLEAREVARPRRLGVGGPSQAETGHAAKALGIGARRRRPPPAQREELRQRPHEGHHRATSC